jgi:hypothetical protein
MQSSIIHPTSSSFPVLDAMRSISAMDRRAEAYVIECDPRRLALSPSWSRSGQRLDGQPRPSSSRRRTRRNGESQLVLESSPVEPSATRGADQPIPRWVAPLTVLVASGQRLDGQPRPSSSRRRTRRNGELQLVLESAGSSRAPPKARINQSHVGSRSHRRSSAYHAPPNPRQPRPTVDAVWRGTASPD